MRKINETNLSQEYLKSELTYDSDTGLFSWNRSKSGRKMKRHAGCKKASTGYIVLTLDGVDYFAHRLAFVYINGAIDSSLEVDHINGIRDDNRFENLRLVTTSENARNVKKLCTNKSGKVGVYYNKRESKWRAFIWDNKKEIHLGYFKTIELAVEAREKAEKKYGYHKNHGNR